MEMKMLYFDNYTLHVYVIREYNNQVETCMGRKSCIWWLYDAYRAIR